MQTFTKRHSLEVIAVQNFRHQVNRYKSEVKRYLGWDQDGGIGNLSREGGDLRSDYKALKIFLEEEEKIIAVKEDAKRKKRDLSS